MRDSTPTPRLARSPGTGRPSPESGPDLTSNFRPSPGVGAGCRLAETAPSVEDQVPANPIPAPCSGSAQGEKLTSQSEEDLTSKFDTDLPPRGPPCDGGGPAPNSRRWVLPRLPPRPLGRHRPSRRHQGPRRLADCAVVPDTSFWAAAADLNFEGEKRATYAVRPPLLPIPPRLR